MLNFILYSAICVFLYMSLIYMLAWIKKDNSIVDIAWGIGFILIAILVFFLETEFVTRHILVTALIFYMGNKTGNTHSHQKQRKKRRFPVCAMEKGMGKVVFYQKLFPDLYASRIPTFDHCLSGDTY